MRTDPSGYADVFCPVSDDVESVRVWNGTAHCFACGSTTHQTV